MWSGGCNILEEPGKKFEQIRILENEYEDTSKSRISFMEILGNSNNKGEINEKKIKFLSVYYFAYVYVDALRKQIRIGIRKKVMSSNIKVVIIQVKLMRITMQYM